MKVKIRHRRRADDDHAADHEEHEDVGRAWTPAAAAAAAAPAAGAALNRRQAREAAGRANRDAELEEDSTTRTAKSTMSAPDAREDVGAADDGDGCAKTMTVCAARTDYPRRPG